MRADHVFCALCMVCPGSAVSWNRQDCNRQSIQQVQNTVNWDWSVLKFSDTNVVFQTAIFLILSYEIRKSHQALKAKSATAFPEIVHITVILS